LQKKFIKKLPVFLYGNLKIKCLFFRKKKKQQTNQTQETYTHTFISCFLEKHGGQESKEMKISI